jgi:hypothetical protein
MDRAPDSGGDGQTNKTHQASTNQGPPTRAVGAFLWHLAAGIDIPRFD